MTSAPCIVEVASFHGSTHQKRWQRCFRGESRRECHRFIDLAVSAVVANDPLTSMLAQEHAREHFRITRLRGLV
jgi:hypothetical protein